MTNATVESVLTCSPSFYVSPIPPFNAEPCAWIYFSYFAAIMAGVVLIIGILAAIFCLIFFLLRKCGLCGGSKPDEAYEEDVQVRQTFIYSFCAFLVVFIALIGVGSCIFFTIGATHTMHSLASYADAASDSLKLKALNLTAIIPAVPALASQFNVLLDQVTQAQSIGGILSGIDINIGLNVIESERLVADRIVPSISIISHANTDLNNILQTPLLNLTHVVSTSLNFTRALRITEILQLYIIALGAVNNLYANTYNDSSIIYNEIVSVCSLLSGRPQDIINNFPATINFFNHTVQDLIQLETNVHNYLQYSNVEDKVNYSITAIGFIFALMFVSVMVSYFIFAVISTTRHRSYKAMHTSSVFSVIFLILFFLSAGILVGITIFIVPYCQNGKTEIINADRLSPEFRNMYPNYTQMVNLTHSIITCTGNETLIDIAVQMYPGSNVSFLDPSFKDDTDTAIETLQNIQYNTALLTDTQQLQVQNGYTSALLTDFASVFGNQLTTFINTNIITPLSNDQLYETDNNINFSQFDQLIVSINNITGPNLGATFTRANISLFDASYYNNTQLTPDQRQALTNEYNTINPMVTVYTNIVQLRTNVNDWFTLLAIAQDFIINTELVIVNDTFNRVNSGTNALLSQTYNFNNTLSTIQVNEFVNRLSAVTNLTDDFITNSQCASIGDGARDLGNNVCHVMLPSLILSSSTCFLIALLLFCMFPVSIVTGKKYENAYKQIHDSERMSLINTRAEQLYGRVTQWD